MKFHLPPQLEDYLGYGIALALTVFFGYSVTRWPNDREHRFPIVYEHLHMPLVHTKHTGDTVLGQ